MEKSSSLLDTVIKIQNYVDEHLNEPITANDLAAAAGYSQYHIIRIFKKETGLSPFEYIRQKRLVLSAFDLRRGKIRVIDAALNYVFDSQEGFTRAFSNGFGISPKRFAKIPKPDGWLIPYCYLNRPKTKTEDLNMEQKTAVIFTQIMERPARKLILFRSKKASEYFEYCEEVGCGTPEDPAPWDILCGIKNTLGEPMGVWLPKSMRIEETGIYAHAVEVAADYSGEIPSGFDVIDLPPCKYMVFQGEPYDDDKYSEAVGVCMMRIEKFNPQVYGYDFDDEIAPKFQLAPMGWRGYIEGRPVREIKKA